MKKISLMKKITSPEVLTIAGIPTGFHSLRMLFRQIGSIKKWAFFTFICAVVVGFFSMLNQFSGPDRFREQLQAESEGDLARILSSLSSESTALQDELIALKVQIATMKNASEQQQELTNEVDSQLNALEVLAGTIAVQGPGITMVIDDVPHQVTYEVIVDAVQELRDAGAEAIAINGKRIGVASSFRTTAQGLTIDNELLSNPYTVAAIGPASTMEGGLKIPGGSIDTLRALPGVEVDIIVKNKMELPALSSPVFFRAARPK